MFRCFWDSSISHMKSYFLRWLDFELSAGATISIKKFLPRHRRRRQATSPFIAEGESEFPKDSQLRRAAALERSSCERSSCSRQLVATEAPRDTGCGSFSSLISPYTLVIRSPCPFVCSLVTTFTIDRQRSHPYARHVHDVQWRTITYDALSSPSVFPTFDFFFSRRDWLSNRAVDIAQSCKLTSRSPSVYDERWDESIWLHTCNHVMIWCVYLYKDSSNIQGYIAYIYIMFVEIRYVKNVYHVIFIIFYNYFTLFFPSLSPFFLKI